MTTYAQLDKYAKSKFIWDMKERGFQHFKTFIFSKITTNGIHYFLSSQILSSKERVRITPFLWVPEFDDVNSSFSYPKDVSIRVEFPGYEYPDWTGVWEIKNENECQEAFASMLFYLDRYVMPWFESIKTGNDLIKALNPEALVNPKIKTWVPEIAKKYS